MDPALVVLHVVSRSYMVPNSSLAYVQDPRFLGEAGHRRIVSASSLEFGAPLLDDIHVHVLQRMLFCRMVVVYERQKSNLEGSCIDLLYHEF